MSAIDAATSVNSDAVSFAKTKESKIGDYFTLLKPRVMSLVVFTGLVGLLIAPGNIHPLLATIAIFCIALGSGAAGAVNMWYERELDAKMSRTQNRPLPQGKILPENAIEFASVCAFASVFIMSFAVNLAASSILLSAILFYVFIYTIWLKPRTPQNIVIGGAAGAFPPMIGWAAVTGSVSIESILLFLIIFFWTPPHFWALALIKNEDYKKAGIPMLPVVAGDMETRRQILFYTITLILVSLMPEIIGMSGFIYTIGAIALNMRLAQHAFSVYKKADKAEKKLFFFSISYLFGIFLLLAIDNWFAG